MTFVLPKKSLGGFGQSAGGCRWGTRHGGGGGESHLLSDSCVRTSLR